MTHSKAVPGGLLAAAALLLGGAAARGMPADGGGSAVSCGEARCHTMTGYVDFRAAPGLKPFAKFAALKIHMAYPVLLRLLKTSTPNRPPIPAVLTYKISYPAQVVGKTISLGIPWFRTHPQDGGALVHELTHVVQDYAGVPAQYGWITEGIADYARGMLTYQSDWKLGCRPGERYNTTGYGCAAALFKYVSKRCDAEFVPRLHAAMRRGVTSSDLSCRGRALESYWGECIKGACRY